MFEGLNNVGKCYKTPQGSTHTVHGEIRQKRELTVCYTNTIECISFTRLKLQKGFKKSFSLCC